MKYIKIALSLSIFCALPAHAMLKFAQRVGTFRAPRLAASMQQVAASSACASSVRISAVAPSAKAPARSLANPAMQKSAAEQLTASLKAGFKGKNHGNSQKNARNHFGTLCVGAAIAFAGAAKAALAEENVIPVKQQPKIEYTYAGFINAIVHNDIDAVQKIAKKSSSWLSGKSYMVNQADKYGVFPLNLAVLYSEPEMVQLLIDLGAHVNAQNPKEKNETVLHQIATYSGSSYKNNLIQKMRIILAAKADPNCVDNVDRTPLHCANDFDVAKLLLDAGANPNIKCDVWGKKGVVPGSPATVLEYNLYFAWNGTQELVIEALLQSNKTNTTITTLPDNVLPRMANAIKKGCLLTVKFYLSNGFDIKTEKEGTEIFKAIILAAESPQKSEIAKLMDDKLSKFKKPEPTIAKTAVQSAQTKNTTSHPLDLPVGL